VTGPARLAGSAAALIGGLVLIVPLLFRRRLGELDAGGGRDGVRRDGDPALAGSGRTHQRAGAPGIPDGGYPDAFPRGPSLLGCAQPPGHLVGQRRGQRSSSGCGRDPDALGGLRGRLGG
jgi:hypothetical protein